MSVLLNVVTLAAGLIIWTMQHWHHMYRKRREIHQAGSRLSEPFLGSDQRAKQGGSDSHPSRSHSPMCVVKPQDHVLATNYLVFLRISAEMFTTLTLISYLVVLPIWGHRPLLLGLRGDPISLAQELDATGLTTLCFLAWVLGLVVLIFVGRLQRHAQVRGTRLQAEWDAMDRTVWLMHLPVCDQQTGEPFLLQEEDFRQVEQDLKEEIQKRIRQRLAFWAQQPVDDTRPVVHRIHVARVVDTVYRIDERLLRSRMKLEQLEKKLLEAEASSFAASCFGRLRVRHYERQSENWREQVRLLEHSLREANLSSKGMAGSAFVTFKERAMQEALLLPPPRCWNCRSYTYFHFGHPPFASVTLRCVRAPHPSDINWRNLHKQDWERILRFWTGTLLLLLFMLLLITPVTVTAELNELILRLRTHAQVVQKWLEGKFGANFDLFLSAEQWAETTAQLPTMVLLLINSVLLPLFIGIICSWTGSHLHSQTEVNCLHLNFMFLVLNQLVIPLLGLTGLPALLELLRDKLDDGTIGRITMLDLLGGAVKASNSPGIFSLKYLLNCAFLTNANSLTNLAQLFVRSWQGSDVPWTFAWGYWYAMSLSIITTGLGLGVIVPCLLPCTAIFFALKFSVDRHNLTHRIYDYGPQMELVLNFRVLHILRIIVGGCWFFIGASVLLTLMNSFAHDWNCIVPSSIVKAASVVMMIAAGILLVWASLQKVRNLHNLQFRLPRVASLRTIPTRHFTDVVLDGIFGCPRPADAEPQIEEDEDEDDAWAPEFADCSGRGSLIWNARAGLTSYGDVDGTDAASFTSPQDGAGSVRRVSSMSRQEQEPSQEPSQGCRLPAACLSHNTDEERESPSLKKSKSDIS